MMTKSEAHAELNSTRCGTCGSTKERGRSFCFGCFSKLPSQMRIALYAKGDAFVDAHWKAKRCILERRKTAAQVGAGRHTRRA